MLLYLPEEVLQSFSHTHTDCEAVIMKGNTKSLQASCLQPMAMQERSMPWSCAIYNEKVFVEALDL